MRVQIVSDLHLEFGEIELKHYDRDLLVLAGDIHVGRKAMNFLEKQLEFSPIIYVLGNHEFYNHEYKEIADYWSSLKKQGLTILDNNSTKLDEIQFFGCVLWTDMENNNHETIENSKNMMNDYRAIRLGGRRLKPEDTIRLHEISVKWLDTNLIPYNDNQVIITHHLPSYKSIDTKYYNSPINGAFYTDLDWLIEKYQPRFWFHGHTHESVDYKINSTRVICNPRGYDKVELNPNFRQDLVIDI